MWTSWFKTDADGLNDELKINAEQILTDRMERNLKSLLLVLCISSTISLVLISILYKAPSQIEYRYFFLLLLLLWLIFFFNSAFWVKCSFIIGILYVLGVLSLIFYGPVGDERGLFLVCTVFALGFFGERVGIAVTILTALSFITVGLQFDDSSLRVIYGRLMVGEVILFGNLASYLFYCFVSIWVIRFLRTSWLEALSAQAKVSSELAKQSAELEIALSTERELNALRTKLITTLSHNFRTPLTVIQNSATLIYKYDEVLNEEKKQNHMENIEASVERLTDLINYILTAEPKDSAELDQIISEMP